jgi:hypothetical protein
MCRSRRERKTYVRSCDVSRIVSTTLVLVLGLAAGGGVAVAAGDGERDSAPAQDPSRESIRAAVVRALPLLVKAGAEEYPRHRDCFSCHNQAVPAVALDLAHRRGFAVEADTLQAIAEHTEADLSTALDDYQKGKGQPGSVIRAGYALWAMEAAGWEPDETTAAVTHYLSVAPGRGGHWLAQSQRPPSESSDFTATAVALRGLHAFGPRTEATPKGRDTKRKAEPPSPAVRRRAEALKWLLEAKPRETEDRVFRLWGLKFAGADSKDLEDAAADLIRTQQPDGGWSQLDGPAPAGPAGIAKDSGRGAAGAHTSDAYATGSTLVALHQAGGLATHLPAYRRGLAFLIKSQRDDGSWFVKSRSHPFQPYFESGFPHGPDQFISAAATGWAVAALALAYPVR